MCISHTRSQLHSNLFTNLRVCVHVYAFVRACTCLCVCACVQVRDVSIDVAVPTDADVGIMVWPGANGSLIITGLKEDSSAMASGLQPGDVLTMVDGIDILQLPAAQVSKMLSGPAGSEVTLTVSRMQDGVPTALRYAGVSVGFLFCIF